MNKLIAVEGIDGSGKSTLVRRLALHLKNKGSKAQVIATREAEHEAMFEGLMNTYRPDPYSPAYMFLFQMLHSLKVTRAREAMEKGLFVVADRWDPSFFVWHDNFGFFSKETVDLRQEVSRLAFGDMVPRIGIYLDVEVGTALGRRLSRGEVIADVEAEAAFYEKVVAAYRTHVTKSGWRIVDANRNADCVFDDVCQIVNEVFPCR